MGSKAWLCFTLLAVSLPCASGAAQVRTFEVERGGKVEFVSDASLERIVGVSGGTSGTLQVDPKKPAETRGAVRVDVASLRTGVDLRDEHLRGDGWLDGARFPKLEFAVTGVSGLSELTPDTGLEPTVTGKLTVHGVTRELSTKARIRYVPARAPGERESLRIQASFVVHLKDHGVSIPSIVALKVSPDIQVRVDLRASAEPPAAPPVAPIAEAPAAAAPEPAKTVPDAVPLPTAKPREKPETAATTKPAAKPREKPAAAASSKPVDERTESASPAPARPSSRAGSEKSPSTVQAPVTPAVPLDARDELHSALRKAHYYLARGETERAMRFVQRAQAALARLP